MDNPGFWRFLVPSGKTQREVMVALKRAGYRAESGPRRRVQDLFLDTQDGRLSSAGARLAHRRCAGANSWLYAPPSGPAEESPSEPLGETWPLAFPGSGFPAAPGLIACGAPIFPVLRMALARSDVSLVAPSATRFLLSWEAPSWVGAPFSDERVTLGVRILTTRLLEGEPSEGQHLAVYLRDRLALGIAGGDACSIGLDALGRVEPGGHATGEVRVGPRDPLTVVARKVVAQQVLKVRANAEGALLDLDPEYLHDLRVATRRLRSALKLFAPALGSRRAESLRLELAWLAGYLGGVRDLDVFIGNLEGHSVRMGEAGRVARVLEAELLVRRALARESLVAALGGKRFVSLVRRLGSLAGSPPPGRPRGEAALPAEVAAPIFIGRAHRRVVKQGRAAVPSGDPAALHRLRILFKRLRYTSEFFSPALGEKMDKYIRAMVKFQDCLGEHQDAVVAARDIEALAREMAARGDLPMESLLDLGSLIQIQRELAREGRERLQGLWKKFDRPAVRKCLAGGREAGKTGGIGPGKAEPETGETAVEHGRPLRGRCGVKQGPAASRRRQP